MSPVSTLPLAEESATPKMLSKDLMLQLVVDDEFHETFRSTVPLEQLPTRIEPQDMTFSELVRDAVDVSACANTCLTGFTILCDGTTIDCRNTCISGFTWKCDGTTL